MSASLAKRCPFLLSLAVRISLALATCTFFQPDEYFQSLEPAHHAVFGFGALTWEWTIRPPLRSFAYPALFVPVYWLLKVTHLDTTQLLIILPKLLQGVIAAFADYYTYKLAVRLYGPRYGNAALFLSLTSFFNILSLTRTLSNSTETSLAAAALYYWPSLTADDHLLLARSRFRLALCLAGLAVAIRPTSAIMWAWMFALTCFDTIRGRRSTFPILIDTATIGSAAVVLVIGVDSFYYGEPTFTPFTFLRQNFFSASPISNFYGQNPWHFYATQALPLLLNTASPFAAYTAWITVTRNGQSESASRRICSLVGWTTGVYSLAGHKEWRFLHPLLPVLLLLATKSVVDAHGRIAKKNRPHGSPNISSNSLGIAPRHLILLLTSLPLGLYVLQIHGRAQISVMHHLRSLDNTDLHSVGFLMPCHSTPWQSYLHRDELEIWALGCEPPIGQRFPIQVDATFPPSPMPGSPPGMPLIQNWTHTWPSHLVFFGALIEDHSIREALTKKGYGEVWSAFNGWEEDARRRSGVKVWQWMAR
ncbi:glycosyltransferase family 22 protein [Calocera cornea HHB12733]|uniref:Mannosyltransferase n=1 Tax=Calocera cornea HHB12733 TaxID=1353952 RepID=A0A165G9R9_9BASI|nr:glycosyltransferase family 22 protein [Calocera cornea HHB12733]